MCFKTEKTLGLLDLGRIIFIWLGVGIIVNPQPGFVGLLRHNEKIVFV